MASSRSRGAEAPHPTTLPRLAMPVWLKSFAKQVVEVTGHILWACISVNLFLLMRLMPPHRRRRYPGELAEERYLRRRLRTRAGGNSVDHQLRRTLSFSHETTPQPESALLSKLPLEIRREIYQLVLAGRNKHFVRLGSAEEERRGDFVLNHSDYRTFDTSSMPPYRRSWRTHALALPLASRQIYCESIDIVYQSAVFKVSRLFTLEDLQVTLLPQRFSCIRSLELAYEFRCGLPMARDTAIREDSDWAAFWSIIATHMTGLRDLRLDLFSFDIKALVNEDDQLVSPSDEHKWRWLRQMLLVRGLKTCHVRLHSAGRFNVVRVASPPTSLYMLMVIDSLERLITSVMLGKSLDAAYLNLPDDRQVDAVRETCKQLSDVVAIA